MHPTATNSPLHQISEYPAWSRADGEDSAIILTTRARIARNLVGEMFPYKMSTDARIRVMRRVARTIASLNESKDGAFFSLAALAPLEINLLVERRTISPQLARDDRPRGVFAWKDIDRAIMVCEEDHVRLTEIVPGLAPTNAYQNLLPVLQQLSDALEFTVDDNLGFLTACPANLGAAVRMSLFCHLPGLVLSGGMEALASHAADAEFTVRGFWGEGSEVLGNTFQFTDGPGLSHQTSDMLSRIESLGQVIVEREAMARIELQNQRPAVLKDRIARALAILQSCRVLSGSEILALFSAIRLGLDIGYIEGLKRETISMLTFDLGKSYLMWTGETTKNPDARQMRRAERVREVFGSVRFVG